MKRFKIMGLCIVAAFTLTAIASSSASAATPEWAHCAKAKPSAYKDAACTEKVAKKGKYNFVAGLACVKMAGGKYKDKGCTSLASGKKPGKYELLNKFTATLPPGKLTNSALPPLECEGGTAGGTLVAPKGFEKLNITFTGCSSAGKSVVCTSAGQAPGTVKTEPLKGTLVYLAGKGGASPKVGVDLESEATDFAAVSCPGVGTIKVKGALIGEVLGDINSQSTASTFKFAGNGKGAQEFTNEEGGVAGEDVLMIEAEPSGGGGFKPFGPGSEETLVSLTQPPVAIIA